MIHLFWRFLNPTANRAGALEDVRWFFIMGGMFAIFLGLIQALESGANGGAPFLVVGGVLIVLAAQVSFTWFRFILLLALTIALAVDFSLRKNPVSIFLFVVGISYVFKVLRTGKNTGGK